MAWIAPLPFMQRSQLTCNRDTYIYILSCILPSTQWLRVPLAAQPWPLVSGAGGVYLLQLCKSKNCSATLTFIPAMYQEAPRVFLQCGAGNGQSVSPLPENKNLLSIYMSQSTADFLLRIRKNATSSIFSDICNKKKAWGSYSLVKKAHECCILATEQFLLYVERLNKAVLMVADPQHWTLLLELDKRLVRTSSADYHFCTFLLICSFLCDVNCFKWSCSVGGAQEHLVHNDLLTWVW